MVARAVLDGGAGGVAQAVVEVVGFLRDTSACLDDVCCGVVGVVGDRAGAGQAAGVEGAAGEPAVGVVGEGGGGLPAALGLGGQVAGGVVAVGLLDDVACAAVAVVEAIEVDFGDEVVVVVVGVGRAPHCVGVSG